MAVLQFILDYGMTIISMVVAVVILIAWAVKAIKSGNTKGLLALYAKIPELVAKAETIFGAGNGVAKLNYVLTELRVYALEHGINVNMTELQARVEEVVSATKVVNITPHETNVNVTNTNENINAI